MWTFPPPHLVSCNLVHVGETACREKQFYFLDRLDICIDLPPVCSKVLDGKAVGSSPEENRSNIFMKQSRKSERLSFSSGQRDARFSWGRHTDGKLRVQQTESLVALRHNKPHSKDTKMDQPK